MKTEINVGVISGKWRLLHQGHKELMLRAAGMCNEVHVLIVNLPNQKRYSTIEQLKAAISDIFASINFTNFHIHLITEELSGEDWDRKVMELVPNIDYIFNSKEDYPNYLIQNKFVHLKTSMDVSASEIEKNIFAYYDLIATEFRPYINKAIIITGDKKCGKTTLVDKIASFYNTKQFRNELTNIENIQVDKLVKDISSMLSDLEANLKIAKRKARYFLVIDTDLIYILNILQNLKNLSDSQERKVEQLISQIKEKIKDYKYENSLVIYIEDKENNQELKKLYKDHNIKVEIIDSNKYDEVFTKAIDLIDEYLK